MLEDLFNEVEEQARLANAQAVILALEMYASRFSKKKGKIGRSKRHRRRLLKVNPFCYYCGIGLDIYTSTIDHVIPQSKGGKWTRENLVLSCEGCNRKKGSNYPNKRILRKIKCCKNQISC
jgi:5-methylcytosine-specific restriction endonuclease McrA